MSLMFASAENERFITQIVREEDKWAEILSKQTGISPENVQKALSVWTTISDIDWGGVWKDVHIYVNERGLLKHGFPKGSIDCKTLHEETEARLCQGGMPRREAHLRAVDAELRRAREIGILPPYIVAEVKSSLSTGLIKDVVDKVFTFFQVLKRD